MTGVYSETSLKILRNDRFDSVLSRVADREFAADPCGLSSETAVLKLQGEQIKSLGAIIAFGSCRMMRIFADIRDIRGLAVMIGLIGRIAIDED